MSFNQDYHKLLCLKDYQVCWHAKIIKVICLFFEDFNVLRPRLSQSSLPQRLSSPLARRDNHGHLPFFRGLQCLSTKTIIFFFALENIKFVGMQRQSRSSASFSKTSMYFDQDYHSLLCLRDYQVRLHAKTIKIICLFFEDLNFLRPRLSQSSLPQRLSSLLACIDN